MSQYYSMSDDNRIYYEFRNSLEDLLLLGRTFRPALKEGNFFYVEDFNLADRLRSQSSQGMYWPLQLESKLLYQHDTTIVEFTAVPWMAPNKQGKPKDDEEEQQ